MDVVKLMTCYVMCGCCEVDDLFCDVWMLMECPVMLSCNCDCKMCIIYMF